jgi:hypothetical protein
MQDFRPKRGLIPKSDRLVPVANPATARAQSRIGRAPARRPGNDEDKHEHSK